MTISTSHKLSSCKQQPRRQRSWKASTSIIMTSTFLLLLSVYETIGVSVASAAVGFGDETIIASQSQSQQRQRQRPKGPIKPYIKGRQPSQQQQHRHLLNQLKDNGTANKRNGLNLLKDGTTSGGGGGAFNQI